ncbi:MAG: diguanylate cyclase [Dehalococcoidia bacterium]|nr:diguanylate cyclase [Dehalococcoidia bacterium]
MPTVSRSPDLRAWLSLAIVAAGVALAGLWLWRDFGQADSGDVGFAVTVGVLVALLVGMGAATFRTLAQQRSDRAHFAQIQHMGRHDDLTGVYTYHELRRCLRESIAAAREHAATCVLLLLDLDDFKRMNERVGHLAGDAVLRRIAAALRETIAARGVVARFGGDEFAIVLPGATREQATAVCAEVRAAVADASIMATRENQHLRVGASCGTAQFPQDGDDEDQLIAAADIALYDAKARALEAGERTAERHAQDVFFAIGEAMGRSLDAQETLDNLVRAVGATLQLDAAAIRLFDADGNAWVHSYYLADEEQAHAYLPIEKAQPMTRDEVYHSGLLAAGMTYIDDAHTSERLGERYRSLIEPGRWMVNMHLAGAREGMLTLSANHARVAPPPTELIHAIARLAEAALQNCDVYEGARRQGDQLARLAGIGGLLVGGDDFEERLGAVAREVGEAFGVDSLTIDTEDPEDAKPFCRHVYARLRDGVTPEDHQRAIDAWRSLRPALKDDETMRFLAALTEPMIIDDAGNSPLVVDAYRDIVRDNGIQSIVLVPIIWQGELKGVFYFASYRLHAFGAQDVAMMHTVASQIAPSLQIAALHVELKHSYDELKEAHLEAILRLAYAAEARDPYTGRHLHRIRAFSGALASEMGLQGEDLEQLGYGAVVHDLGKLRIPDSILIKAGELSDDEWKVMKRHPEYGAEFLGSSSFYDVAREVAMHHHERWDGSGYPRGLTGEEIPLVARIVSVADVYDALTSDRPYKVAWPPERALAELLQMRGKSLCPHSVDAFLRLWNNGTIAAIERESGHASFEFDFRERFAA